VALRPEGNSLGNNRCRELQEPHGPEVAQPGREPASGVQSVDEILEDILRPSRYPSLEELPWHWSDESPLRANSLRPARPRALGAGSGAASARFLTRRKLLEGRKALLRMEASQQKHRNKHERRSRQREVHCLHHDISKNAVFGHDSLPGLLRA